MKIKLTISLILVCSSNVFAQGRFYYEGNGCLNMYSRKSKTTFNECYRNADGSYNEAALKKIDAFFQIPASLKEHFSLRTLSFLDYLQDKYVPDAKIKIIITSGYRSLAYNNKLRKKGKLAGKTSYHIEGMAADVTFPGVKSEDVWEYARSLNYGGMGYYRSKELHIDSGKPRYWIPETAIEPDSKPPLNKNLYMSVDKDIYFPGEVIEMFFSGISDYPYGIKPTLELFTKDQKIKDVTPAYLEPVTSDCLVLSKRDQVRKISWVIPQDIARKNEKLHFKVTFCDPTYANQPEVIDSREFEIREAAVVNLK